MLTDRIHGVIRAVRVGMGQIVPRHARLSTGLFRSSRRVPGKLEPCLERNEFRLPMSGAWPSSAIWS
jgi:hypothetical protein